MPPREEHIGGCDRVDDQKMEKIYCGVDLEWRNVVRYLEMNVG